MELQIIRGGLVGGGGRGELDEADDEACDSDLRANIDELGDYAPDEMRVFTYVTGGAFLARVDFGELGYRDHDRDRDEDRSDHQIGNFNGGGLGGCGGLGVGEDECGSDQRSHDGSDGIERLGEVQAALGAFGRAENGHIGIRGDFEKTLAACHHKKGGQKKSVPKESRGRDEQESSACAEQEAGKDASFVSDAIHQSASGPGGKKVSAEEGDLNQRRFEIGQTKGFLEMRDENVVEIDAERPEEKQASDQRKRNEIPFLCEGRALHERARSRWTYPPSTYRCWPVMCPDWGERRNRTIAAISSAVVMRLPRGIRDTISASFASGLGKA